MMDSSFSRESVHGQIGIQVEEPCLAAKEFDVGTSSLPKLIETFSAGRGFESQPDVAK